MNKGTQDIYKHECFKGLKDVLASKREIGMIENHYGGLHVYKAGDRYFWAIENYDGVCIEEITKKLYNALVEFDEKS